MNQGNTFHPWGLSDYELEQFRGNGILIFINHCEDYRNAYLNLCFMLCVLVLRHTSLNLRICGDRIAHFLSEVQNFI